MAELGVVIQRGEDAVTHMAAGMRREMRENAFKGNWLEKDLGELYAEVLYHAYKLGLAIAHGHAHGALEYAADTANCAMFVADKMGVLGQHNHLPAGGIDRSLEGISGAPWAGRDAIVKDDAQWTAQRLIEDERIEKKAAEYRRSQAPQIDRRIDPDFYRHFQAPF